MLNVLFDVISFIQMLIFNEMFNEMLIFIEMLIIY